MNTIVSKSLFYPSPSKRGVLLVHGFTGSPSEYADFGTVLQEAGFNVAIPLLPGHGTDPRDLNRSDKTDWVNAAEKAYLDLEKTCDEMFIVGLSMGCMVTLQVALRHPETRAIACMAAPFWIRTPAMHYFLTFMDKTHLWNFYPQKTVHKSGNAPRDPEEVKRFSYSEYPLRALRSLVQLINETKGRLHEIRMPVLLVHSKADTLIPYSSMAKLAALLPTPPLTMTLEEFGHVIPCHPKRRRVFTEILNFFESHSKKKEG